MSTCKAKEIKKVINEYRELFDEKKKLESKMKICKEVILDFFHESGESKIKNENFTAHFINIKRWSIKDILKDFDIPKTYRSESKCLYIVKNRRSFTVEKVV